MSDSSEKIQQALEQLKSSDPSARKRAIQYLARAQDRSVIPQIQQLRDFDPDDEVRILAARAVRYIKDQTQTIPAVSTETGPLKETRRRTGEVPTVGDDKKPRKKPETGSLLDAARRRTGEVPVVRDPDASSPRRQRRTGEVPAARKSDTGSLLDAARRRTGEVPVVRDPDASSPRRQRRTGEVPAARKSDTGSLLGAARRRTGEMPVIGDDDSDTPAKKGSFLEAATRRTGEIPRVTADDEDTGYTPSHKRLTQPSHIVQPEEKPGRSTQSAPVVWGIENKPLDGNRDLLASMIDYSELNADELHHHYEEQARRLIDGAYSDFKLHDPIAGIDKMVEALRIDPRVEEEDFTEKTVTSLVRVPYEEGLKILKDNRLRDLYILRVKKDMRGARMFTTWWSVAMDSAAVFAAQFIGLSTVLLVWAYRSRVLMANISGNQDLAFQIRTTGINPVEAYQQYGTWLFTLTTSSVLIYAAIAGALSAVLLFIGSMASHAIASFAMGGTATVTESEANFTVPVASWAAIVYAITAGVLYMLYPTTISSAANGPSFIIQGAAAGAIIGGLGFVVWWQARYFGTAHGIRRGVALVPVIVGMVVAIGLGVLIHQFTGLFTL